MAKAATSNRWIYGPRLDLLVGCGAWSGPLLLLAYPFRGWTALAVSGAFYALALLFNYPHYMATIYRAYHTREDFQKYRIFTIHLTGLLLVTLALTHGFPRLLPWLFTIYLTWSPWHYMGQNFGLAMMFARRNGAQPAPRHRNLLYLAFLASYAMVFLSIHARPSSDTYVLSLGLPMAAGRVLRLALAPLFLVAGAMAFRGMAATVKQSYKWRPLWPAMVLFSTEFLWFVLPSLLEAGYGFRIPQQRYADGVLAVMHSAQYLWITSYYARQEARAGQASWNWRAYFGVLVAGGIALFVPGPWLVSRFAGMDFTASFLAFTALVNIHHFILDGAIWKLRDVRVGAVLGTAGAAPPQYVQQPASKPIAALSDALDWLRGASLPARALRRGAVAALLLFALLDQVKYDLTLDTGSLPNLRRAQILNPNDSALWLNLASAQDKEGHVEDTVASLQRAIQVNPQRFDAHLALALYYLRHQRYPEATAQYQDMERHFRLDAGSWLNYGLLEWQGKRIAEAIACWRNAESLDPKNKEVQLYLAEAYVSLNRDRDAIRHYERYIVLLSERRLTDRGDAKNLALISMKLAAAYQRTDQTEPSRFYSEKAALLAQQAQDPVLESVARFRLADALRRLHRQSEALRNYQAALQLDLLVNRSDPADSTAGADWLTYAQFLQTIAAPRPFVLAAYLEAEKLLGAQAGTRARAQIEKEMGAEAALVRKDLEPFAKESLQYALPN